MSINDEPQYGGLIDWSLIKVFIIIFIIISGVFLLIDKLSKITLCQFFNTCEPSGLTNYSWIWPVLLLTILLFSMLLWGPMIE